MISTKFSIALAISLFWTVIFSIANHSPIRSLRNFGILACYVIGVVMFFKIDFRKAAVTWIMFGFIGGMLYMGYELFANLKAKSPEAKMPVSISNLVYGPFAWPIMAPEAIEYTLAELGILKVSETATDD